MEDNKTRFIKKDDVPEQPAATGFISVDTSSSEELLDGAPFRKSQGVQGNPKRFSYWWILLISIVALLALGGVFLSKKNISDQHGDRKDMNLHGNVIRLIEKSLYSGDGMVEQEVEGGLFDDNAIMSLVYSDEHMARIFYKKWFLSQVSDCEIQFDEHGNILFIRSLSNDGGEIHFTYDSEHLLVKMDGRDPAGNQNEGLVSFSHEKENDFIVSETITEEKWNSSYTIEYHYDAYKNIRRAIMDRRGHQYIFSYEEGRLTDLYFEDFWREGVPVSIQIEYNSHGDIEKVTSTGRKGYSSNARVTTFDYQYDSFNNWTERIGKVVFSSGEEYKIKTTRTYNYR